MHGTRAFIWDPASPAFIKPCPHCRRKVLLSPKTARKRRQSPNSATVALFCDSRRYRRQIVAEIGDYSRQCGQAFRTQASKPRLLLDRDLAIIRDPTFNRSFTGSFVIFGVWCQQPRRVNSSGVYQHCARSTRATHQFLLLCASRRQFRSASETPTSR